MATVYDKSSLFLAPSGVSNGTVFVQKPVPIYGSELVTNGDFASNINDWAPKDCTIVWDNGKIKCDNSSGNGGGGAYQNVGLQNSKTYRFTATIQLISASGNGTFRVFSSAANGTGQSTRYTGGTLVAGGDAVTEIGEFTTGTDGDVAIQFNVDRANAVFTIDNVSVKEVLSPDGDFTFTRGSNLSATRVNEAQLIEKGRENLLLQSNQFDTTWAEAGSSGIITSGFAGYDGTNDAWQLEHKGSQFTSLRQTLSSSGVQTYSLYAKAGTLDYVIVYAQSSVSPKTWFNLSNGTIGTRQGSTIDASIESVGNGWYRCTITFNDTLGGVRIYPNDANGTYGTTSGTIYIQDAQLEQGLAATSVITTGAVPAQAGLLENTPRLDYSGGASCPSLLLEPQRTNLITHSEYFETSEWTTPNVVFETNKAISPDGEFNAAKFKANSANSTHWASTDLTLTSGQDYTFKLYVKSAEYDWVQIALFGTGWVGSTKKINFNASTGEFGTTDTGITFDSNPMGNGWHEVIITNEAASTSGVVRVYPMPSDNATSYQGDGASGIYIYGAQFEQGTYPTSYIPTYGTSQTRAKDVCGDAGDAATFNSTEGVLYAEIAALAEDSDSKRITISDGTLANRITLSISDNIVSGFINVNNVTQYTFFESGQDVVNPIKIAVKYKANDFAIWINGVEYDASTSGNTFSSGALSQLSFDNASGVNNFYGNVKQLIYFPKALSDLQLAILTGATTYETFDEMALALNYTVYE